MRICVENGVFTVSFLKESIAKVTTFVLQSRGTSLIYPSYEDGLMIYSKHHGKLVKAQTY
jgi:hypothetical protein